MVVLYGVPEWAAVSAHGCERDDIGVALAPDQRPRLRRATRGWSRSLQDLAGREGVDIRWWSPWNEPNGPFFISPQRAQCNGSSKSLAPAVYAKLARALRPELAPGQQMVVGELAGLENARKYGTSISEFFDGLPDDVVCNAGVFAQHHTPSAATPPTTRAPSVSSRRSSTAGNARRASRSGSPRAASAAPTSATALAQGREHPRRLPGAQRVAAAVER